MNQKIIAIFIFTLFFIIGVTHGIEADIIQIEKDNITQKEMEYLNPPPTLCEFITKGLNYINDPEYQMSMIFGSGYQAFNGAYCLNQEQWEQIEQLGEWCNGGDQPASIDPELLPVYICSSACLFNAMLLAGVLTGTAMSIVGLTTVYALIGIAYPIALAMAGLMSGTLFIQGMLCYGLCYSQFGEL